MAKAEITVTTEWVQIAAGAVVLTITTPGEGVILFNTSASETAAYRAAEANASAYDQFEQTESVATFVKATGAGWVLIADGVLA